MGVDHKLLRASSWPAEEEAGAGGAEGAGEADDEAAGAGAAAGGCFPELETDTSSMRSSCRRLAFCLFRLRHQQ
jgi:hypothetical protein